jgi:DNA-binding CsgD family transcriptional regulator
MTAFSLSTSTDLAGTDPTFGRRSLASRMGSPKASRFPSGQSSSGRQASSQPESSSFDWLWGSLLESLPQGVAVLSRALQPVYFNQKAKECAHLLGAGVPELPSVISEICHRLLRKSSGEQPIVMECQVEKDQTLRVSARWLAAFQPGQGCEVRPAQRDDLPAYILVFLENCTESLQQELQMEQQKYDLTDREAEVWVLLRQEYSYQEIAKLLQISLNTVKTHVKNVYAKKRSCVGREKFWCAD